MKRKLPEPLLNHYTSLHLNFPNPPSRKMKRWKKGREEGIGAVGGRNNGSTGIE